MRPTGLTGRWLARAAVAVVVRPALWATALGQMLRLAAPGWWRRQPFLPLPDHDYLRFRLQTMYGGDTPPEPAAADLITYLRWCREWWQRKPKLPTGRSAHG